MQSLTYCYWALGLTSIYLAALFMQKRYRLLLPSVVHSFIWLVTVFLIVCQLNGWGVSKTVNDVAFNLSCPFICILMMASMLGFVLAHVTTSRFESESRMELVDVNSIDYVLAKFKWVPYLCGVVGIILFIFLITTIGSVNTFSDYRVMSICVKREGAIAIVQRISGHINILGSFYLMLLGYKYGQTGMNLKNFLKYVFLCSIINIGIGGRVWILTSTLPFFSSYLFSRKFSQVDSETNRKDAKKIGLMLVAAISLFSVLGNLRNDTGKGNFMDSYLYLTDGPRMTNMVLTQYPEGSYDYEYGKCTLAQYVVKSPMLQRFDQFISGDIGLSVTVKSIMPCLYYDFGFWGGAVFWGLLCFVLEYIYIQLKYRQSIVNVLVMGQLSILLFQTPVGNVFSNYMPAFIWLIILFLIKDKIFSVPKLD